MKNIFKIIVCLSLLVITNNVFSQTYATPELKAQAEKWEAERLEWIKKNPEEYRKQGGDPEAYIKENTKVLEKPAEVVRYKSPVDLKDKSLFILAEIIAVDINHKHTETEMIAYNLEAKGELEKLNYVIDFDKNTWYYIPRNTQKQPYAKVFNIENKILQFTNCKECEDNMFTIIEQTQNTFTVQLKPQDEGQFFVYQITFKK